jgi:hypothetical protein
MWEYGRTSPTNLAPGRSAVKSLRNRSGIRWVRGCVVTGRQGRSWHGTSLSSPHQFRRRSLTRPHQHRMDAPVAVRLVIRIEYLPDHRSKPFPALCRCGGWSIPPFVESGTGDLEPTAHEHDVEAFLIRDDEPEDQGFLSRRKVVLGGRFRSRCGRRCGGRVLVATTPGGRCGGNCSGHIRFAQFLSHGRRADYAARDLGCRRTW